MPKKTPPPPTVAASEQWFELKLQRLEKRRAFWQKFPAYILMAIMLGMVMTLIGIALYGLVTWIQGLNTLDQRVKALEAIQSHPFEYYPNTAVFTITNYGGNSFLFSTP